jgi:transcriptional regulator with XRE-family HTH domain
MVMGVGMNKKEFQDYNAIIGKNIRLERKLARCSQSAVGKAIGVTFQQIQKYELGRNGITAARLFELATYLNVPITRFFTMPQEQPLCEPHILEDDDTFKILSHLSDMKKEEKKALAIFLSAIKHMDEVL